MTEKRSEANKKRLTEAARGENQLPWKIYVELDTRRAVQNYLDTKKCDIMSLYTKGQLVWAKIKGYPWWPGVIAETNLDKNGKIEKEILVNFIGENSHAVLTQDKVADFTEKEKQYSKSKNKKLQESIEVAQRILNREVTYEEERQKLLREAERIQASINEDKPKPGNRGRPSLKKKLEVRAESTPTEKDDEVLSNAKEMSQKEKEKGLLYSFNEDVLGLHKKKSSPEREKDTEIEYVEKANPKVIKQDQDSRLVQKLKLKEKEREKKHDREAGDYHDYLPFKITRVKIERDPSDVDMESASKSNNRKKTLNSDSSRISRKETSTTSDTKHTKDIQEVSDEPAKIKARLLIDDDDLLSGYQNSHMPPCFNDKQEEEYTESPTKPSERRLSEKMEFEEEKESHKSLNFETNASRNTNDSKVTTNSHIEPTKAVQVPQMHSVSPVENNLNNLSMNNKRPGPDIVKDTLTTEKVTKGVMGETESKEYPSKKVKLASNQSVEEEKELDEKVLGSEVYNVLLIKKFEDNLRRILDKLSNKLQGVDRLKEYDVDMIKILEVIEEFESRTFDGSEFIGSDLGKILKTVHYLLITHKHKLPKTGDLVIIALAKVLHKIKDKIIKFCMDNTEYVDALHLPRPKPNPTTITAIDIDFEEIKAKMEEIGTESKADAVPIATKIEEESTSSYSQVQKHSVQVNDINVLKQPATRASVQQATSALPHYAGIKEISTENNKENHMVRPNELHANDLNLLLRKKICQKLAKLLQRSYLIDRDRSQKMTLLVEDKLNKFYSGNVSDYKQAIKGLHKLIKVQMLREDELTNILTLSLQQFQQLLREKLSKMNAARGSTHYTDASPIDYDDQLKGESQFPNQENSNFDFNTYLNPKANNVLISKDKPRKKSGGEVRQKMIIEDSNPLISNFIQTKQEDES